MQDHQSHRGLTMQPHVPASVAAPVRQSLRGLRDVLHLGRDIVQDVIEHSPLPPPVSHAALTVLAEVDRVAERVEGLATDLARGVLGEETSASPVHMAEDRDGRFADAASLALREALMQLGAPRAAVDKAAIARLHTALRGPTTPEQNPVDAARLVRLLLRDALRAADPAESEVLPVAAFAAVLWLLSDRTQDPAALAASIDLSAALAPEVRQAVSDEARLAGLLAEFRDHV